MSIPTNDRKGYRAIHNWVERRLGKPKECSACGENDPERQYDWANISGEYKRDLSDWERLCKPCHTRRHVTGRARPTKRVQCYKGHEFTPENTYYPPRGYRLCRKCKRDADREALRRFRAKSKLHNNVLASGERRGK